jgi:hypothetical protein
MADILQQWFSLIMVTKLASYSVGVMADIPAMGYELWEGRGTVVGR